ncbi:hypothetical protein PVAG01_01368 [Phlyctema vagabunda]|uniref:Uncharacterized protein n=1 Tax=Phlyctema vagabunda TaxID=108571 RepID=A0ABR4PWW7_9HELO
MWKRRQQRPRPSIGDPVLIETTLDESTYSAYGNPSPTGLGIQRPSRPTRSESEDTLKELPRSPLGIDLPPPFPNSHSNSSRPVSSIYSQPSPDPQSARFTRHAYRNEPEEPYEEEVSPPSSPEYETYARRRYIPRYSNEAESSIREMAEVEHLDADRPESRSLQSNIPTLRREKRRNQNTNTTTAIPVRKEVGRISTRSATGGETRFDKYTGEPTTGDNGARLGVKPGHFTPPALRSSSNPGVGNRPIVNPASKTQPSFSDRFKKLGNTPTTTIEKPEWKGSSGRVALVSPVQDQFDMPPLNVPRRNASQVPTPPVSPTPELGPVNSSIAPETEAVSMQRNDTPATRSTSQDTRADIPRATPSPVVYASEDSRPRQLYSARSDAESYESPVVSAQKQARSNTLDEATTVPNQLHTSTTAIERDFREAIKGVTVPPADGEPPSRFSVTTYTPSTAANTPRPSHDGFNHYTPPMPSGASDTPSFGSAVMDRKRPTFNESPKPISRKQVGNGPYNSPVIINMRDSSRRAPSIASSYGKTLPMSPAELVSRDMITALHAQIDDLSHRRTNISKSIRQMTELMPTDNIILTEEVRRKRELEKTKIENLRAEEDDIRQQEHDLGLKLHRAYKRREKEACYEPIGFWVRRATS